MRDEMASFRGAGAQPVGVNPASVDSHAAYARAMGFTFPLLSDPDRAIAHAYGALKDDGRSIQRTVYAVHPDGLIAFAVRGAPPTADILTALER